MPKIPYFRHNVERQVKGSNSLTFYSSRSSKLFPTARISSLMNPATISDPCLRSGFCNLTDFSTVYRMTILTLASVRQIMFLGILYYYPYYLVAPWVVATLDTSTAYKGEESRTHRLDPVVFPALQIFLI